MCPVPKAVQENPDKEAIAIPVATVDLAAELNSSEDTAGLIHNSHNNQSTEQIVQKLVITVSIRYNIDTKIILIGIYIYIFV